MFWFHVFKICLLLKEKDNFLEEWATKLDVYPLFINCFKIKWKINKSGNSLSCLKGYKIMNISCEQ